MNKLDLEKLKELQVLDLKINSLKQTKEEKPRMLEEKKEVFEQRHEQLGLKQEDLKNAKVDVDKKNLDLKEYEEKTNKLNTQLNIIKTNREYTAILTEINGFKADSSKKEDEILALFAKGEDIEKECTRINKELDDEQKKIDVIKQEVGKELIDIEKQLEDLYQLRKKNIENIPYKLIQTYEKIIAHKTDFQALAQVVDSICQGCYMNVTSQQINELMQEKETIICRNCSRILYL